MFSIKLVRIHNITINVGPINILAKAARAQCNNMEGTYNEFSEQNTWKTKYEPLVVIKS